MESKTLASKLNEVFQEREEIRVAHPVKSADIGLSRFDDSITTAEVIRAVTAFECFKESDVLDSIIRRWSPMAM